MLNYIGKERNHFMPRYDGQGHYVMPLASILSLKSDVTLEEEATELRRQDEETGHFYDMLNDRPLDRMLNGESDEDEEEDADDYFMYPCIN